MTKAYLVNYSVALVPCQNDASNSTPTSTRKSGILRSLLGIAEAQAGHGGAPSPLQLIYSAAEQIGQGDPWSIGSINYPDIAYCGIHYLFVRSFSGTRNIEGAPEVRGLDLYLSGSFRKENEVRGDFTLRTPEAFGKIIPLTTNEGKPFAGKLKPGSAITITRHISKLLDNIDLLNLSATSGRTVFRNLLDNTTAVVTLAD